jgi:hypothetical protein
MERKEVFSINNLPRPQLAITRGSTVDESNHAL